MIRQVCSMPSCLRETGRLAHHRGVEEYLVRRRALTAHVFELHVDRIGAAPHGIGATGVEDDPGTLSTDRA